MGKEDFDIRKLRGLDKKIIEEKKILLRGLKYDLITFEDGEQVLKRYSEKTKIELIFTFAKKADNEKIIEEMIETAQRVLGGT